VFIYGSRSHRYLTDIWFRQPNRKVLTAEAKEMGVPAGALFIAASVWTEVWPLPNVEAVDAKLGASSWLAVAATADASGASAFGTSLGKPE
jgi:hypothetical protein